MNRFHFASPFLSVLFLATFAVGARAELLSTPLENTWAVDGEIRAMVQTDNTLVVGGLFNQVYPITGAGVACDLSTQLPLQPVDKLHAHLNAVISDGGTGWYVAGLFSSLGGVPTKGVAHILSDGTVDPAFVADVNGSPLVALAKSGTRLFIGGQVGVVNGSLRHGVAALNATTGALIPEWAPTLNDGYVNALQVRDTTLYVGGLFSFGTFPLNAVGLNVTTGLSTWNPVTGGANLPNGEIFSLWVDENHTVYVGGAFDKVGFQDRRAGIAAYSSAGELLSWNPFEITPDPRTFPVIALAEQGGNIVAAYKDNAVIMTRKSDGIAAGYISFGEGESAFHLIGSGEKLYVAGNFTQVFSSKRKNFARFSRVGAAYTVDPLRMDVSGGFVRQMALVDNKIYLAGNFRGVGGVPRNNLAAIHRQSGQPLSWDPQPNGPINAIEKTNSKIIVGGQFTSISGQTRSKLVAYRDFDLVYETSWVAPTLTYDVYSITHYNDDVYVAGGYLTSSGANRRMIHRLNEDDGSPQAGFFPGTKGTAIRSVAATSDGVYIGGSFESMEGTIVQNFAKISGTNGGVIWNGVVNGPVNKVVVGGVGAYVGGDFTAAGGQPRNRAAVFVSATGNVAPWNPDVNAVVHDLATVAPGNNVALAGWFTTVGSQSRSYLALVDGTNGTLLPWNPAPNTAVTRLTSHEGVIAAGPFANMGSTIRAGLAIFPETTSAVDPHIDTVAPAVGTTAGGTTITITGTNFVSGCEVHIDGIAVAVTFINGNSVTAVTPPHAAGLVSIRLRNPSLRSHTKSNAFEYQDPPDAPKAILLYPGDGDTITSAHDVTVRGSHPSGVQKVEIRINGGAAIPLTYREPYYYWTWSPGPPESNGTYVITATVFSNAGTTASDTATITFQHYDSGLPGPARVRRLWPEPGNTVKNDEIVPQVVVHADIRDLEDPLAVLTGSLVIDGTEGVSTGIHELNRFRMGWNTALIPDGIHDVQTRGRNAAGQQSTSYPIPVIVNNAGPLPPYCQFDPQEIQRVVSGQAFARASIDSSPTPIHFRFWVDNQEIGPGEHAPNPFLFVDTTDFDDGEHWLRATIRDGDGITNSAPPVRFLIANQGGPGTPTIQIAEPVDGATVNGELFLRANTSDTDGVVMYVAFLIGDEEIPAINTGINDEWVAEWDSSGHEGPLTIRAWAIDDDGYDGFDEINVTVTSLVAEISSPENNDVVEGVLPIQGTANGASFHHYILEYKRAGAGGVWTEITNSQNSVTDGLLGHFDTRDLPEDPYTVRLRTIGSSNGEVSDEVLVNVVIDTSNRAPTVDAGPDRRITIGETAFLDGTLSDDAPHAVTLTWSKQSGPGTVQLDHPHAADTVARDFSEPGTYVMELRANDSPHVVSDFMIVTVDEAELPGDNQAPVVNAGPDITIRWPVQEVTLDGSVDDDGLPTPPATTVSQWIQVSGPGGVIFGDTTLPETTARFTGPGVYALMLSADDGQRNSSDLTIVTVLPEIITDRGILTFSKEGAFDVIEGGHNLHGGPKVLTLTVSRVGGTRGRLVANYITRPGSAKAGEDYVFTKGRLEFAPDEAVDQVIEIPMLEDSEMEGEESFTVELYDPTGESDFGTNGNAFVVIHDNDGKIDFSLDEFVAMEDQGSVRISVSRYGSNIGRADYTIKLIPLTATPGQDYTDLTQQVIFEDGDTMDKSVVISLLGDASFEGDEMIGLQVLPTNPGQQSSYSARLKILENDAIVRFGHPQYVVRENNGIAEVALVREFGAVGVATATWEARAQHDLGVRIASGTVVFKNHDSNDKKIEIPIVDNGTADGDRFINLQITGVQAQHHTEIRHFHVDKSSLLVVKDDETAIQFEAEHHLGHKYCRSVTEPVPACNPMATHLWVTVKPKGGDLFPASVEYATEDGSALDGRDYTGSTGAFGWGVADVGERAFEIPILYPQIVGMPQDRTFYANLFNALEPPNVFLGDPARAEITIPRNPTQATPNGAAFVPNLYSVKDTDGVVEVQIARVWNNGADALEVDVWTTDGTALKGVDYVETFQHLSWAQDDWSVKTVTIPLLNDHKLYLSPDNTRRFHLKAGSFPFGQNADAVVGIVQTESRIRVAKYVVNHSYKHPEAPGVETAVVGVTRLGYTHEPASVGWASFYAQEAEPHKDYAYIGIGDLSWDRGDGQEKFMQVPILPDRIVESDERFNIVLTLPGGAELEDQEGNVVPSVTIPVDITDDDTVLSFTKNGHTTTEMAGAKTIGVMRRGGYTGGGTVHVHTQDMHAKDGEDYNGGEATFQFRDGERMTQILPVTMLEDEQLDGTETFTAHLTNPTGVFNFFVYPTIKDIPVKILDNEVAFLFSIDKGITQYHERNDTLTIGVTRLGSYLGTAQVRADTFDGTATHPQDYQDTQNALLEWPLRFTDNRVLTIPVHADTDVEAVEEFKTVLRDGVHSSGGTVFVIPNGYNEETIRVLGSTGPSVYFESPLYAFGEGVGMASATIRREGALDEEVSVRVRSIADSAGSPADYVAIVNQLVTFAPNETFKQIDVTIVDDTVGESFETFGLELFEPSDNISLGDPWATVMRINDNDELTSEPPTVLIVHPSDGDEVTDTVTILVDAHDNVAVDRVEISIDGGAAQIANSGSPYYEASWNTDALEPGPHTIVATAFDVEGQSGSHQIVVNVIPEGSNTPPTIQVRWPENGDTVSGPVNVLTTAQDDQGIQQVHMLLDTVVGAISSDTQNPYRLPWDTSEASNGPHDVGARATDISGQQGSAQPVRVEVANNTGDLPPYISFDPPFGSPLDNTTVGNSFAAMVLAYDDHGLEDVRFYIGDDTAGLAPEGGLESGHPWVNIFTTDMANGTYWLRAKATDSIGQVTSAVPVRFIVNHQSDPAWINIIQPSNGDTVTGQVIVRAEAANPSGTIDRVEFRFNDSAPITAQRIGGVYTATWNSTSFSGPVTIVASLIAGNQSTAATDAIDVTVISDEQNQPPAVQLIYPEADTDVTGAVTALALATDTDGTITEVTLRADDVQRAVSGDSQNPYSLVWNTDQENIGPIFLRVRAKDNNNQFATSDAVRVTVVRDPNDGLPTIALTAPANEAIVGVEFDVTATVSDAEGVVKVEFFLNNETTPYHSQTFAPIQNGNFTAHAGPLAPGRYRLRARVTDTADHVVSAEPRFVTVSEPTDPTNEAPVVNAGVDQTLLYPAAAPLAGGASDDGLPNPPATLTYAWTKVSGPSTVEFDDANAAVTDAHFGQPGVYTLRLTASDSALTGHDDIVITVQPSSSNQAPVVDAGEDATVSISAGVDLNGTISDDGLPVGTLLALWSKSSGPGTVTFMPNGVEDTHATFSAVGTYVLRLAADDTELLASDTVTITVVPAGANLPPTVNAGPDRSVTLPGPAQLSGAASDDGLPSNTLTLLWTKREGPGNVVFDSASSAETTATFDQPGTYFLRLTANDSALSSFDEMRVIVSASENQSPVVNAGVDQNVNFPSDALLNGSATDDGLPVPPGVLTMTWAKVTGPGSVTFGDSHLLDTTAHFSEAGVYTLSLLVTDGAASGYDEVVITSLGGPANQAPTVNAGVDQSVALADGADLSGVAEDDGLPNGTLILAWSKVSGPGSVAIAPEGTASTHATFTEAGTYVLRLSADDSELLASDTISVTVTGATGTNQAPVVNAGLDQTLLYPNAAPLAGSASDDGLPVPPGTLTYTWSKVSGPGAVNFDDANTAVTNASFIQPGVYTLRLTASDGDLTGHDDLVVTSQPGSSNQPPLVEAGADQTISMTVGADLAGQVSDDGLPSGSLVVLWSKTSGPGFVSFNPVGQAETHATFSQPGTYVLRLTADDSELLSYDTLTITVVAPGSNLPPVVNAGPDVSVELPNAALLVGTANDDGLPSNTLSLQWTQREGPGVALFGAPTSAETSVTFDQPGTYFLRLTANDGALTAFDETRVVVSATGNQSPVVNAGVDQNVTYPNDAALNGSATDDGLPVPPGALTYTWAVVSGVGAVNFGNNHALDTTVHFGEPGIYVLSLTASDGQATGYDEVVITSQGASNQPPTVNAGTNMTVSIDAGADLNGVVTDDGLPSNTLVVLWSKSTGPGFVTFTPAGTAQTHATFSQIGTYELRLAADDTELLVSDTVTVTVVATGSNLPPTVNVGPDQSMLLSDQITLSGNASDDGLPNPPASLTFAWTKQSGPGSVTFVNPNAASTLANFGSVGTYQIRLTASDSEQQGFDELTVVVTDVATNAPPTVNAGADQFVVLPSQASLSGSASDDGLPNPPATLTHTWTKQSGSGVVSFGNATSLATNASFNQPGSYQLRLTADDSALSSFDDVRVVVSQDAPGNNPPTVQILAPINDQVVFGPFNAVVQASDDHGVDRVEIWLDGIVGGNATLGTDGLYRRSFVPSEAGQHILTAIAWDDQNEASQHVITIVFQTTPPADEPPQTQLTFPGNNDTISGSITALATASDDHGVAKVELLVDGVKVAESASTTNPYALPLNTTLLSNDEHILQSVAEDTLGQRVASLPVRVIVNNGGTPTDELPRILIIEPLNGATVPTPFNMIAAAFDDHSVAEVRFFTDDDTQGQVVTPDVNGFYRLSLTLPEGSHVLRAQVRDNAGQFASATPVNVTVDADQANNPPTVQIVAPQNGDTVQGLVVLKGTASDNSAVTHVYFQVDGGDPIPALVVDNLYQVSWLAPSNEPGAHVVVAVATDDQGLTDTDFIIVNVGTGEPPVGGITPHPLNNAFTVTNEESEIFVTVDDEINVDVSAITNQAIQGSYTHNNESFFLQGNVTYENRRLTLHTQVPANSRVTWTVRLPLVGGGVIQDTFEFVRAFSKIEGGELRWNNLRLSFAPNVCLPEDLYVWIEPAPAGQIPLNDGNDRRQIVAPLLVRSFNRDGASVTQLAQAAELFYQEPAGQVPIDEQGRLLQIHQYNQDAWHLVGGYNDDGDLHVNADGRSAVGRTPLLAPLMIASIFPHAQSAFSNPILYPNPFNPIEEDIKIRYFLNEATNVRLMIYDLLGNLVLEREYTAGGEGGRGGENNVSWNGRNGVGSVVGNGGYILQFLGGDDGGRFRHREKVGVYK